jgi:hypothetical protein
VQAAHTIAASFSNGTVVPYPMASGNYQETFADIANWTNNFASGTGASRFGSVAVQGTGTIPDGVKTTVSTATFTTGTTGGVQKGTGNIVLLSTGTTDNSTADAIDLFLDFTSRNAGTLSFDWATVFNSTGDRKSSLRVYTSVNGTTFTELTAAGVLNFTNNVTASGTISAVALPAAFSNSPTARIRFYYHNGSGGTTGSRPKISIDNVAVTGTAMAKAAGPVTAGFPASAGRARLALSRPLPNPGLGATVLGFSLPAAGHTRIEILDLGGRLVWATDGDFPAGDHSVRWEGRGTGGSTVSAGVYFVRLQTPFGGRTARLVRL